MSSGRRYSQESETTRTVWTVLGGTAIAVLTVLASVFVASLSTHGSTAMLSAPSEPTAVDPEFLPQILSSPTPTSDGAFGSSVAMAGSTVVVGAPQETGWHGGGTDPGRAYILHAPYTTPIVLQSPQNTTDAELGYSVAVGSGVVAASAVSYPTSGVGGSGMVCLYSAIDGAFVHCYGSPNPTYDGEFGYSVAISGHWLVVGAPRENDSGGPSGGHAYLYNLETGSVTMLTSPIPDSNAEFGLSVAISGNTVAIGAPTQQVNHVGLAGEVFVFQATTGDLITNMTSPNAINLGEFGWSVAVNGTFLVVGAPYETAAGLSGAGRAYVYDLNTGSVLQFHSPAPAAFGLFGTSVAAGSSTFVAGAPNEPSGVNTYVGNAYLFSFVPGANISSTFAPPDWPVGSDFGSAVAENGTAVLIGSPDYSAGGVTGAGHAFLYPRVPLTISFIPQPTSGPWGNPVSIDSTIAVGDPTAASTDGRAYLFPTHTSAPVSLNDPSPTVGGSFGQSVSIWHGVVVVGAPGEGSPYQAGQAYIFNATTDALVATLSDPSPVTLGAFGASVSTDGRFVAVGAYDGGTSNEGTAYVFNASTGALVSTLIDPNATTAGEFGYSVSVSNGGVLVGAPGDSGSRGGAYLYSATSGALLRTLSLPSGARGFGSAVALNGGTAVVGAPETTLSSTIYSGEAFAFNAVTGALLHTFQSPALTHDGYFGSSVVVDDGIVGIGAPGETAFGILEAGNEYLYHEGSGVLYDRYNSPTPTTQARFAESFAIGPAGVMVGGQFDPSVGLPAAYEFFL